MTYAFRTLIVQDSQVQLARDLAETLAGQSGAGMFTAPLSSTGGPPVTHWISTGLIGQDFASLLPLVTWTQDAEGNWVSEVISAGQPEIILALASEAGLEITLEDVNLLLSTSDCTEQEWPVAVSRLGLQAARIEEPELTP